MSGESSSATRGWNTCFPSTCTTTISRSFSPRRGRVGRRPLPVMFAFIPEAAPVRTAMIDTVKRAYQEMACSSASRYGPSLNPG